MEENELLTPKIVATEDFPLRGFLKCPNCDRRLSGSASKGKMGNYYHCSSACGTRFKADTANEAFLKQLRYLSPKEGMVDVFIEAFIKDFNNKTKAKTPNGQIS